MISLNRKHLLALSAALISALAACAYSYDGPLARETADRLAHPVHMVYREIVTKPFVIATYERVRQEGAPADIYIEGDGVTWHSLEFPASYKNTFDPKALHLATRDKAENVIYMARPCQFTGRVEGGACGHEAYWREARYGEDVITSMNAALDEIKRRYNIPAFNIIGYDGGAAVGIILASTRDDILTLRTVAGVLDTEIMAKTFYDDKSLPSAVNPLDYAPKIAHVPQHHFIGEWDKEIPPSFYSTYNDAIGDSPCVRESVVLETTHDAGWVNKWPELLHMPVDCKNTDH